MTRDFAPMLAAKPAEGYKWQDFPWERGWLMSPKIDGVRVICHPELGAVTRSLKPVPNKHIREMLGKSLFRGLDGEVVLNWNDPKTFGQTVSAVMSHEGKPRFEFRVFDNINATDWSFETRLESFPRSILRDYYGEFSLGAVPHELIDTYEKFAAAEQNWLDQGFEGAMIRDPNGRYKFGRSTWKEKGLIKVKRYEDAEGRIVDWKPLMRNNNPQQRNELGYAERSSEASGLEPDWDRIGALVVEIVNGPFEGATVDVGSGFTDLERLDIRLDIDQIIHERRLLTFKYMPHGSKNAPRHPIYKGMRGNE